jgi:hypothetical protein
VATLTRPPLRAEIPGAASRPVTLKAVARDRGAAVAEASVVTSSTDVAGQAPECRVHADCAAPEACVEGRCSDATATLSVPAPPPAPDGGAPRAAADGGASHLAPAPPAGCAVAAHAPTGDSGVLAGAVFLLALCAALGRRRVARGVRT